MMQTSRRPRYNRPSAPLLRHARGITLIEVLVTMVLLGVGLLGLAGLQLRGMQVNQGSTFRSQASILAEDLADRMRADAATAAAGGYDGSWLANGQMVGAASPVTKGLVADWVFRMGGLPSGCATVDTVTFAPARKITVTWDDTRAIHSANANDKNVVANAPCVEPINGQGNGSYVLMTE